MKDRAPEQGRVLMWLGFFLILACVVLAVLSGFDIFGV